MYNTISNVLFFLVLVMIGITAYSMFSGKVELIPYIQMIFAFFLVTWGILEYKEDGKKTSFLYFGLAFIATIAAFYNFFGK